MKDVYRVRATRAEQEAARLREELARRPNYEWFVELIRKHLRQSDSVHSLYYPSYSSTFSTPPTTIPPSTEKHIAH